MGPLLEVLRVERMVRGMAVYQVLEDSTAGSIQIGILDQNGYSLANG